MTSTWRKACHFEKGGGEYGYRIIYTPDLKLKKYKKLVLENINL